MMIHFGYENANMNTVIQTAVIKTMKLWPAGRDTAGILMLEFIQQLQDKVMENPRKEIQARKMSVGIATIKLALNEDFCYY